MFEHVFVVEIGKVRRFLFSRYLFLVCVYCVPVWYAVTLGLIGCNVADKGVGPFVLKCITFRTRKNQSYLRIWIYIYMSRFVAMNLFFWME